MIYIYTDGGCWPNPGNGAWAIAVVHHNELIYKECHAEEGISTNNICEIKAILKALYISLKISGTVIIKSDSQYAINSITKWAESWKKNGWKKKGGEIKNLELIKEANAIWQQQKDRVDIVWVKGHNGNKWNELCDELCAKAISEAEKDNIIKRIYNT